MRSISVISFILVCFNLFAQEIYFERINSSHGLSQNNVLGIVQDKDGYMWFGSYDGLNRYDGYEFKIYREEDDPNSPPSSLISLLTEDKSGNLWFATFNKGLCKFNKTTQKFTRYTNSKSNPDLISGNTGAAIFCDTRNNIWYGSITGLSCLQQRGDSVFNIINFKYDSINSNSISHNYIKHIYEDRNGNILLGTHASLDLLQFNDNNISEYKITQILTDNKYYEITSCLEVPEGLVVSHHYGLILLNIDTVNPDKSVITNLDEFSANKIAKDYLGNLWVSSFNGLYYFERKEGNSIPYKLKNHYIEGSGMDQLSALFIKAIYYDKNQILWIGTNGGGILKYNHNHNRFRYYSNTEEQGSISNNKIWGIYEDNQNNLWVGTEGGGVNFLSNKFKNNYQTGFISIDVAPPNEQNYAFDIVDISSKTENKILVGSGYNSLLAELKLEDGHWKSKPILQEMIDQVMVVEKDEFGTIWLGSYLGGLGKYTDKLIIYKPENSNIPTSIIRSIFEDSKGRLWIGTDKGLMLISRKDKILDSLKFTLFKHDIQDSSSISKNYTVPVFETSMGEIWIGTFGKGINIYKEGTTLSNGTFSTITMNDGLPNNTIKAMVEDNQGNIWVSTNYGLTRIGKQRTNIRNFTIKDGLQNMEFTDLSGYKRHDGEILFGGVNGFIAFYPEEIKIDTIAPILVFNEIEVMNELVKVDHEINGNVILNKTLNETDTIVLKYKQNNFKIYFAAIQYTAPLGNRFKYMLEGFDSDWKTAPVEAKFANYTNLPVGWYTFLLKGCNSDGLWTKEAKKLYIWIKPPFWLTTWFKVTFPVFIVLILISLIRLRFRNINNRNRELEHIVSKRTKELIENNELLNETNTLLEERQQVIEEQAEELRAQRDSLEELNHSKDKFYSILAHDLKSPFNTLLGYIELLKFKFKNYNDDKKLNRINIIYNSANTIFKLVENLLTWSRSQRGLIPFNPVWIKVDEEASKVIKLLHDTAAVKSVELVYKISNKSISAHIDSNIFRTILRNLISNAIKYTSANDTITVDISKTTTELLVSVSDTGVGIPQDKIPSLFKLDSNYSTVGTNAEKGTGLGLVLCKELVEKHNGNIGIESEEGEGTKVTFMIPLNPITTNQKSEE